MIPITTTDERGTLIGKIPKWPKTIPTKNSAGIDAITIRFAEHFTVFSTFDIRGFLRLNFIIEFRDSHVKFRLIA